MTEQPAVHPPVNTNPGNSIFYKLLVIGMLLVAVGVVYTLILRPDLIPTSPSSPTLTATRARTAEPTMIETTMTVTPSVEALATETPALTETPASPASLTPAFGACQYALKPGTRDFLYAIYWNWQIDKNIPDLQNYYARITCALLLSNLKCNYQASNPNVTQPGWILMLPGVSANICLSHGGTPVP